MADLHVYPDRLEIRLTRAEKALALRREDVVVRRDDIRSVAITEDPWIWIRGIRAPGMGVPLALAVGVWKFHGGKDFVIVKGKQRSAVIIDIEPDAGVAPVDAFSRVIVSTPHATRLIEALRTQDPDDQAHGQVI